MVKFEVSIDINKPPEIVDEALWNPANALYWTTDLEKIEVLKGKPREVGLTGLMHYNQKGKKHIMEDVLEYSDPCRKYRSRVSGPALTASVETTLESFDGKTKMTIIWDGKGKKIIVKLLLPFLRKKISKLAQKELETFKRLIETYGIDFTKSQEK